MKTITVKVLPRSSKNEVVGKMDDGALKVKLTAAPVDGEANKALIKLLSVYFSVPISNIKIVKGQTNSLKKMSIF